LIGGPPLLRQEVMIKRYRFGMLSLGLRLTHIPAIPKILLL